MKDLQIVVLTRTPIEGTQAFAIQASGMQSTPPIKSARIRSSRIEDALVDGILLGLQDVNARLDEGDHVTLRLPLTTAQTLTGASLASLQSHAALRTAVTDLRRRGVAVNIEQTDEADLPPELSRRMLGHLEMGAMLGM